MFERCFRSNPPYQRARIGAALLGELGLGELGLGELGLGELGLGLGERGTFVVPDGGRLVADGVELYRGAPARFSQAMPSESRSKSKGSP